MFFFIDVNNAHESRTQAWKKIRSCTFISHHENLRFTGVFVPIVNQFRCVCVCVCSEKSKNNNFCFVMRKCFYPPHNRMCKQKSDRRKNQHFVEKISKWNNELLVVWRKFRLDFFSASQSSEGIFEIDRSKQSNDECNKCRVFPRFLCISNKKNWNAWKKECSCSYIFCGSLTRAFEPPFAWKVHVDALQLTIYCILHCIWSATGIWINQHQNQYITGSCCFTIESYERTSASALCNNIMFMCVFFSPVLVVSFFHFTFNHLFVMCFCFGWFFGCSCFTFLHFWHFDRIVDGNATFVIIYLGAHSEYTCMWLWMVCVEPKNVSIHDGKRIKTSNT